MANTHFRNFTLINFAFLNYKAFSSVPSLKHYDTLHSSQLGHSIVKRGIKESNHPYNSIKELSFSALGKDFRLILHPSKGILHHNFQSYAVDGDGIEKPILGGLS